MAASAATIDELSGSITGHSLKAEVHTTSARADELLVAQPPSWLEAAAARLLAIAGLEEGWDSYGARRVSLASLRDAMELLARFADLGLPQPGIMPTSAGGIQFEWDVEGIELEIELQNGGGMLAMFDDATTSWERELPPNDLVAIADALHRIRHARRRG